MTMRLQQEIDLYLGSGQRTSAWLRLPGKLEDGFTRHEYATKRRETAQIIVLAAVLVDFFLFSDYSTDPTNIWRAMWIRLGIFTPCTLIALWIYLRSPSLRVRELTKAFVIGITGECVLVVAKDANVVASVLSQTGMLLVIFFALLVLRLRLPYAVLAAAATTGEEILFLTRDTQLQAPEKITCFFLVATGTILALHTARRLEGWERTSYLHLRREESRNEELSELSQVDGLTGLANRRHFDEQLRRAWRPEKGVASPLSVIMFDIDHFKRLNDTHGHLTGDHVLVELAGLLRGAVRAGADTVARFGGEEFVVILPGANEAQAFEIAEEVRLRTRERLFRPAGSEAALQITISCGVASVLQGSLPEAIDLLEQADRALYRAKRGGRDRVCSASLDEEGKRAAQREDNPGDLREAGVEGLPG